MAQGKYLMALAVVASISLFMVGFYAMEYGSDKDDKPGEGDDMVTITFTFPEELEVRANLKDIQSGVPFEAVRGYVNINTAIPVAGTVTLTYTVNGSDYENEVVQAGVANERLYLLVFTAQPTEYIIGNITFIPME